MLGLVVLSLVAGALALGVSVLAVAVLLGLFRDTTTWWRRRSHWGLLPAVARWGLAVADRLTAGSPGRSSPRAVVPLLRHAARRSRLALSADHALVPSGYLITVPDHPWALSAEQAEQVERWLEHELEEFVRHQGWRLARAPHVTIVPGDRLTAEALP